MIRSVIWFVQWGIAEYGDLFYVRQRVVDGALLWLALMLVEIGLQLELGLIGIQQKLLSRAKREPAKIAITHAGRDPNESDDSQIAISHAISWQGIPMESNSSSFARFPAVGFCRYIVAQSLTLML